MRLFLLPARASTSSFVEALSHTPRHTHSYVFRSHPPLILLHCCPAATLLLYVSKDKERASTRACHDLLYYRTACHHARHPPVARAFR